MHSVIAFVVLSVLVNVNASHFGSRYKCAPCMKKDRKMCPKVKASASCQIIQEPNCGCCKMCARKEGESCGVSIGNCQDGLYCRPPPAYRDLKKINSLQVLQYCYTKEKFNQESKEIPHMGVTPSIIEILPLLPSGNFSEIPKVPFRRKKRDCWKHWETVWNKKYYARHEWIPECRRNGFYLPLQCELSFGLVRGRCWCVNKNGKPITGFVSRPDKSECYRSKEKKNRNN